MDTGHEIINSQTTKPTCFSKPTNFVLIFRTSALSGPTGSESLPQNFPKLPNNVVISTSKEESKAFAKHLYLDESQSSPCPVNRKKLYIDLESTDLLKTNSMSNPRYLHPNLIWYSALLSQVDFIEWRSIYSLLKCHYSLQPLFSSSETSFWNTSPTIISLHDSGKPYQTYYYTSSFCQYSKVYSMRPVFLLITRSNNISLRN